MKKKTKNTVHTRLVPLWAAGVGEILCDLCFPRRCPVCDRPVRPFGCKICPECEKTLVFIREPRCLKCGKQLEEETDLCHDCRRLRHRYNRGLALYTYGSVRGTIYRLKYAGRREYADYLGERMAGRLGRQILSWYPDALVPIPLHPLREKKRGYNQAALLARSLGRELGIPVLEGWLIRVKNTRPMKELEGARRQNNLKKAFKIAGNEVKLDTIVIIDDIYTTGSTIDEAALVCRRAGVRKIYFVTLAIGKGLSL